MRTHIRWAMPLTAATGTTALPIAAQATTTSPAPTSLITTTAACAKPLHPGGPVCFSLARPDIHAVHADALTPDQTSDGYRPSDLRSAYQLSGASTTAGSSATVAVMENADDPNLEADLGTYRSQYSLPACTTNNGRYRRANQSGQQGNYPPGETGWGTEASLDVDLVSAICPTCHVLVVEAGDLGAAQNTAVSLGAHFLSNSWGTGDSSGDAGTKASSRYVVAAGGTSLNRNSPTRGWSETAWSGSGAGCSSRATRPTWQTGGGCNTRTVADVSAVADRSTAVAVYDTYSAGGWFVVGGTSASPPIITSVFALAGATASDAASMLYAHRSGLNDVTPGSDGSYSQAYLCNVTAGYDAPTGLGTPNGLGAFTGSGGSTGAVTSGVPGKCLDDFAGSSANGTIADLYDCNGTPAQQWTVSNNTLQANDKCLDITNAPTTTGSPVELRDCNGGGNHMWQPGAHNSLANPASGRCLDDPGFSTTNAVQLDI